MYVKRQHRVWCSNFYMQLYLSQNDATLSPNDTAYSYCNVNALAVNATFTCSGTVTIPSSIPAGSYFLIVRADDGQSVNESSENNNTGASASSFTIN